MNESDLSRNIISKINFEFKGKVWCYKTSDRFQKGIPDILGIVAGVPFAVEVKLAGKKPDPKREAFQRYHISKINQCGGRAIVAYSEKQVIEWMKSFFKI